MSMTATFRDLIAAHAATLVRYIGLVDKNGKELSGGGYMRLVVTWHPPKQGTLRPTEDLIFDAPLTTVGGWRGYDTLTGGTDFGGANVDVDGPGNEFTLIAAKTAITFRA